jgi:hypothetical protein
VCVLPCVLCVCVCVCCAVLCCAVLCCAVLCCAVLCVYCRRRVADLFQSVQLNVNNPHFLIMQGRVTKVRRACSTPRRRGGARRAAQHVCAHMQTC